MQSLIPSKQTRIHSPEYVDDDEQPLHVLMTHMARWVHFKGFWPALCRRRLLGFLDKDLEFVRGSTPVPSTNISETFRAILDKHWKRFGADFIDELLTVGVVAVRKVKIATGDDVPTVISSEGLGDTHQITVRFDVVKNQRVYRVYRARSNKTGNDATWKLDRQAVVLSDFGHEPMLNGELRSIAWNAVVWETYWQSMLKFSYEAEYLLMRPTIVAQQPQQAAMPNDTSRHARYGDARHLPIGDQRGQYETSGANGEQQRLEMQIQNPIPGWAPPSGDLLAAQTQHFRNVLTLAPGQTVGRQQLPSRNTALPELARMYESGVSALYGIPRSQMVQDMSSATRTASSEMSNETLRHTIMQFSALLAKAYTWAYNDIYGEDELERSLQRVTRRLNAEGKPPRALTQDEIFQKAIDGARVRVVLSMPPTVSQGDLFFLYTQGIITWEEYHASLRTLGGFTARQAPAEPPKTAFFPPPEPVAPTADGQPAPPKPKPQRIETLAADYIMQNGAKK